MIIVYIQVKRILKKHILKLLQNQKDYWKKYIQSGGQDLVMKAQIFFMLQQRKGIESTL
jgi:hypothetical protein